MPVLLVNDNSDNPNIGCRATSIALGSMLSSANAELDTLNKSWSDRPLYLSAEQGKLGFVKRRLFRSCLSAGDWITEDIKENTKTFFRKRSAHPRFRELADLLGRADTVVINGEGSAIFRELPRRDLLFQLTIVQVCHKLGKPVSYVNAMVSPPPSGSINRITERLFFETMQACESVILRDIESHEVAANHSPRLNNLRFCPDALFASYKYCAHAFNDRIHANLLLPFGDEFRLVRGWKLPEQYVAISGSSLSVEDQAAAYTSFLSLTKGIKQAGFDVVLIPGCVRDEPFLKEVSAITDSTYLPLRTSVFAIGAVLARAFAFVSGRYHPSILASFGGVPSIFLRSNSHKTRSLQSLLQYRSVVEFSEHPGPQEIGRIVEMLRDSQVVGDENRSDIKTRVASLCEEAWKLPSMIPSISRNAKNEVPIDAGR